MEREALKLALEVMKINLTLLEKVDPYEGQEDLLSDSLDLTHKAIAKIKTALAQPWPDLNKRDRESYQKGHNDGVAHHKQSIKAAQPAQEPVGVLHIERLDKWLDASLQERKQREWVGLTDPDFCHQINTRDFLAGAFFAEAKLKDKNT